MNETRPDRNPVLPKLDNFEKTVKDGLGEATTQLKVLNTKFTKASDGGVKTSETNQDFINDVKVGNTQRSIIDKEALLAEKPNEEGC